MIPPRSEPPGKRRCSGARASPDSDAPSRAQPRARARLRGRLRPAGLRRQCPLAPNARRARSGLECDEPMSACSRTIFNAAARRATRAEVSTSLCDPLQSYPPTCFASAQQT
eukprot:3862030-Pyramimonas_sp.AAC.1